jgi:hypothetical protein
VWNVGKGKAQQTLTEHNGGHTGYVQGVAWDPADEFIVSISQDRTAHVYASERAQLPATKKGKKKGAAKDEAADDEATAAVATKGDVASFCPHTILAKRTQSALPAAAAGSAKAPSVAGAKDDGALKASVESTDGAAAEDAFDRRFFGERFGPEVYGLVLSRTLAVMFGALEVGARADARVAVRAGHAGRSGVGAPAGALRALAFASLRAGACPWASPHPLPAAPSPPPTPLRSTWPPARMRRASCSSSRSSRRTERPWRSASSSGAGGRVCGWAWRVRVGARVRAWIPRTTDAFPARSPRRWRCRTRR